jgi:hypothetical protein
MIPPGSKQPNVRRMRLARCRYSSLTAAGVGYPQSAAGNSRPAGIGVPGGALCASAPSSRTSDVGRPRDRYLSWWMP